MTNDIQSLARKITELKIKCMQENMLRADIKMSDDYEAIEKQIEELNENIQLLKHDQQEMLDKVHVSDSELEVAKLDLIKLMKETGTYEVDNVSAKFKRTKEVDTREVMNVLEGDLDNFFLLAKVQQNTLKDFVKGNPEYKGLYKCIKVTSEELVDIDISLPE